MHLFVNNVNDAFRELVERIHSGRLKTVKTLSRNGPVLQVEEPVMVTYRQPRERVLFNPARDANPWFHLMESLWMIVGRNDVAPLLKYNSKIVQFSDDGETFNGAYGYRWRNAKVADVWNNNVEPLQDQLNLLVEHLKAKPESRRAVLQMWTVEDDLLKVDSSRDVCCNLSVMFSIREEELWKETEQDQAFGKRLFSGGAEMLFCRDRGPRFRSSLAMTVTNRSNDLIWGLLGANAVHFSFLQEYMAARLGIQVGVYNHFSSNVHVYTETNSGWKPEEWLRPYKSQEVCEKCLGDRQSGGYVTQGVCEECHTTAVLRPRLPKYGWSNYGHEPFPLVKNPETFDREVQEFVDNTDWTRNWEEPFLQKVAAPLCWAWELYKRKDFFSALKAIDTVESTDWRDAGKQWLERREAKITEKRAHA